MAKGGGRLVFHNRAGIFKNRASQSHSRILLWHTIAVPPAHPLSTHVRWDGTKEASSWPAVCTSNPHSTALNPHTIMVYMVHPLPVAASAGPSPAPGWPWPTCPGRDGRAAPRRPRTAPSRRGRPGMRGRTGSTGALWLGCGRGGRGPGLSYGPGGRPGPGSRRVDCGAMV